MAPLTDDEWNLVNGRDSEADEEATRGPAPVVRGESSNKASHLFQSKTHQEGDAAPEPGTQGKRQTIRSLILYNFLIACGCVRGSEVAYLSEMVPKTYTPMMPPMLSTESPMVG